MSKTLHVSLHGIPTLITSLIRVQMSDTWYYKSYYTRYYNSDYMNNYTGQYVLYYALLYGFTYRLHPLHEKLPIFTRHNT